MLKPNATFRAALFLLPLFSGLNAATPAIGVATANGKFTLNHATHRNNATLFEGNTFDSGTSDLELRLADGTIVQLGASARGTIFRDHIVIQDGGGDVRAGSAYAVEVLKLQIKPASKGYVARVVVSGGQVKIGALKGQLEVVNEKGIPVATIAQGDGEAFTPQNQTKDGAVSAGTAAGAAAGTAAGAAAGTAGVVAAGTAAASAITTTMVVAGVAVVGVGAATGIAVASSSNAGTATLSPSAR